MKVAIIAAELSGDKLGAFILKALQPHLQECIGVGGPSMLACGMQSILPMHTISVMGFVEPLLQARSLYKAFKKLQHTINDFKPDILITIDAPDLNMRLAKKIIAKHKVHVVSPSVWAWRPKRALKMASTFDALLTLFPFEKEFYPKDFPVFCIGHPLARELPLPTPKTPGHKPVLALIPGSRKQELDAMVPLYAAVAKKMQMDVVWAVAHEKDKALLESYSMGLHARYVKGAAAAADIADVALVTSGTATLEVALMQTPMVVVYKTSWLNFRIIKCFITTPFIALPNILLRKKVVPELIQHDANAHTIENAVRTVEHQQQVDAFTALRSALSNNELSSWMDFLCTQGLMK